MSSLKEQHDFGFNFVFEEESNQDLIFNTVARPVIDNCLEGFNGTIFAYGQTGSGKTFTMSGGDEWETRGIIPRVIGYLFSQFYRAKHKFDYELSVSYIEIYN